MKDAKGLFELISAAAAAVIGVMAAAKYVGENRLIAAATTGIICIAVCALVLHRRAPSTVQDIHGLSAGRVPAYNRWARRIAFSGLIGIPATFLGLWAWRFVPPTKTIVLVANFAGPDSIYRLTFTVLDELRKAEQQYPKIRIKPLGRAITPDVADAHSRR